MFVTLSILWKIDRSIDGTNAGQSLYMFEEVFQQSYWWGPDVKPNMTSAGPQAIFMTKLYLQMHYIAGKMTVSVWPAENVITIDADRIITKPRPLCSRQVGNYCMHMFDVRRKYHVVHKKQLWPIKNMAGCRGSQEVWMGETSFFGGIWGFVVWNFPFRSSELICILGKSAWWNYFWISIIIG